jgi:hypothetical protein
MKAAKIPPKKEDGKKSLKQLLSELVKFKYDNFNVKPSRGTELGRNVYNATRKVKGAYAFHAPAGEEAECQKKLDELAASMAVTWGETLKFILEQMQKCTSSTFNFHPLTCSPSNKFSVTKMPDEMRIDGKFWVNFRDAEARRAKPEHTDVMVGFDAVQHLRHRIINLHCGTTVEKVVSGVTIQLAQQPVVDFLYLALRDVTKVLTWYSRVAS